MKLEIGGQELRLVDRMVPGILFDVADAEVSGNQMQQIAVMRTTLYALVLPVDHERLRTVLYDTENAPSIEDMGHIVGNLIAEYARRPQEQPSESPVGSPQTELPTRVVSFSQATVKAAPRSPRAGRSPAS